MMLVRTTLAVIIAAVALFPKIVISAQNDFEINLKELRGSTYSQPLQQPKRKHRSHADAQVGDAVATTGHESVHMVQPGEYLFRILMQRYGMSQPAAERLIPEVMRLNNITTPKRLKVGQLLRIPLPAKDVSSNSSPLADDAKSRQQEPATLSATVQASPQQGAPPSKKSVISIIAAPHCELARTISEKMGVLTSSPHIKGEQILRAACAGRSVTVACNLSRAEIYTYGRLLSLANEQLLTFDGSESIDQVVEKLARHLGLAFQKHDSDSTTLTLVYTFAPYGVRSQEVLLTIFPALSDLTSPASSNPEK